MSEEFSIEAEAADAAERSATDEDDRLGFNQLFELLAKKRRRYALYCFTEMSQSTVSLDELVDRLGALEADGSVSERRREEIELALQHTHLPKLVDAAVIEYDRSESAIEFRGGSRLEQWVTEAAEAELDTDVLSATRG